MLQGYLPYPGYHSHAARLRRKLLRRSLPNEVVKRTMRTTRRPRKSPDQQRRPKVEPSPRRLLQKKRNKTNPHLPRNRVAESQSRKSPLPLRTRSRKKRRNQLLRAKPAGNRNRSRKSPPLLRTRSRRKKKNRLLRASAAESHRELLMMSLLPHLLQRADEVDVAGRRNISSFVEILLNYASSAEDDE
jgi:hypothetical protein